MEIDGIDLDGLAHETKRVVFPSVVPGRVAHIDADFLAYQCSYEKATEQKSWEDMKYNAGIAIETLTRLAGAEKRVLHMTDTDSDKGGRFSIAMLKEYQANRKNRTNKPRFLDRMKKHIVDEYFGIMCKTYEADDSMSSYQWDHLLNGGTTSRKLSVIVSKDKDLMMVPGLHVNWNTGEIIDADPFGDIWLDNKGSTQKCKGYGSKFFWAQMLMGDTADNICGLPRICLNNKIKTCGPATAFAVLNDCKTDAECFYIVRGLYKLCGLKAKQYLKDYRDGTAITPDHAFISEAKLLWMRRTPTDADCVAKWMVQQCKK